jgi:peptidoglycan L-alanyl-D-glutamate endopeptidase CwlK
MSANMNLKPYVKQQAEKLLVNANKKLTGKYEVRYVQGFRSIAEQDALYAQGRTDMSKPKVTNAKGGQSMHNFGLAVDFALFTKDGKEVSWNTKADYDADGIADWMEVVAEAKKLGFEWGGNWRGFVDMPHFQMLGGLEEHEIRAGKLPKFPKTDAEKASQAKLEKDSKGKVGVTSPQKPSATPKKPVKSPKKYQSLVDYLKGHDRPSSYKEREKLAHKYGIEKYTGSAKQNEYLLNKLQK